MSEGYSCAFVWLMGLHLFRTGILIISELADFHSFKLQSVLKLRNELEFYALQHFLNLFHELHWIIKNDVLNNIVFCVEDELYWLI